jgi:tripartite-type tricarboxylate transporter receptor subunit TctC
MACLLFNQALGIRPTSVAYRGTGPAMNDLVGGHIDFLCEQSVSVAEQITDADLWRVALKRCHGAPNRLH